MVDIVEKLRTEFDDCPEHMGDTSTTRPLVNEAADEITALRARVKELEECLKCASHHIAIFANYDHGQGWRTLEGRFSSIPAIAVRRAKKSLPRLEQALKGDKP